MLEGDDADAGRRPTTCCSRRGSSCTAAPAGRRPPAARGAGRGRRARSATRRRRPDAAVVAPRPDAIAWTSDEVWERVDSSLAGPFERRISRDRDLAAGVVLRDGVSQLPRRGRPGRRPRCSCCGSRWPRPRPTPRIERATLDRLAARAPALPDPVGRRRRATCSSTCCSRGDPAIDVIETLDQRGLWVRIAARVGAGALQAAAQRLPPLHRRPAPVRGGGQRRRRSSTGSTGPTCWWWAPCCTTSARATRATTPRSASTLFAQLGPRMGFEPDDVAPLQRDGPPPPAAARRRHPPRPLRRRHDRAGSAEAVGSRCETLRLLDALTEADSQRHRSGGVERVEGRAASASW